MITITTQYILATNNALYMANIAEGQTLSVTQDVENAEFLIENSEDDLLFNLNLTFNELQIVNEDEKYFFYTIKLNLY